MAFTGKQLHTTLSAEGVLTVEMVDHEWAAPNGTQVLVQVEATPINPSDLALLFGPADTVNAQYSPGQGRRADARGGGGGDDGAARDLDARWQ